MLEAAADKQVVYLIELEQDKWYLGITHDAHMKGQKTHGGPNGARWTALYKPLRYADESVKAHIVSEAFGKANAEDLEHALTVQAMDQKGWHNVRGGKYLRIYETPPSELYSSEQRRQHALCYGHASSHLALSNAM